jgi:hypothetical protein
MLPHRGSFFPSNLFILRSYLLANSRPRKSFSCNTYGSPRKCYKQKAYGKANFFKCNTYKKQGWGPRPSAAQTSSELPCSLVE